MRARRSMLATACVGLLVPLFSGCSAKEVDDSSKKSCPPLQEPTGVTEPVKVDPDNDKNKVEVVDSGFKPYPDVGEHVTFGFVVENTSDMVLRNGVFEVKFIDQNGDNTLDFLRQEPDEAGMPWSFLDSLTFPVVMPGEQSGIGGSSMIWKRTIDPDDGSDSFKPDEIDFDELKMEIDLVSGEWWPVNNDKYRFMTPDVSEVEVDTPKPVSGAADEYLDGTELTRVDVTYSLDYPGCKRPERGFHSNAVAYDSKGDIVGGRWPIPQDNNDPAFAPGANEGFTISWMRVPEDVEDVTVFPYAAPLEVKLKE